MKKYIRYKTSSLIRIKKCPVADFCIVRYRGVFIIIMINVRHEIDVEIQQKSKQKNKSSRSNLLFVVSTFQDGILRTLKRVSFLNAHAIFHSLIIGHLFWYSDHLSLTKTMMYNEMHGQKVCKMAV